MAEKAGVVYTYRLPKYLRSMVGRVLQLTAAEVRNKARGTVRVDTSRLRNSIRVDNVGGEREVSANTPYALAQEFGRPDLPRYGYTPYMGPAAKYTADRIPDIAREAHRQALKDAKA